MKIFSFVLVLFLASSVGQIALAQSGNDAVVETNEVGESGLNYLKSLRFSRIETDVVYFDPTRAAPALDTRATPPKSAQEGGTDRPSDGQFKFGVGTIAVLIILGIAWVFYQSAGRVSLSLGPDRDFRRDGKRKKTDTTTLRDPPELSAILEIADRRIAIVALAQSALFKVAKNQGLILQRSWTARDSLRKIARSEPGIPALKALVMTAERVHFGHRDISEGEFDALVSGIRPVFGSPQT